MMVNLFLCEASGINSKAAQDVKLQNDMFPCQSSFSSSFGVKEEVVKITETKYVLLSVNSNKASSDYTRFD